MTRLETAQRAYGALTAAGIDLGTAQRVLDALAGSGITLSDDADDELVVRWVDVQVQPVPPDADTIIRTITTTLGDRAQPVHILAARCADRRGNYLNSRRHSDRWHPARIRDRLPLSARRAENCTRLAPA